VPPRCRSRFCGGRFTDRRRLDPPGCIGCHLVGIVAGDLSSAVSLNGVVMNSARVVGPALARVLIVTIGTTPCFTVTAVSYVAVIAALVMLRPLRPGVRGRRAQEARQHPVVRKRRALEP